MAPPMKQKPSDEPSGGEKRPLPAKSVSPSKRQAVGDENDDDEVVVFTPPKEQVEAVDLLSDSPQAAGGHTMNPNILFPHARALCGVFKLEEVPETFCEKCFCVVCDIPAKDCQNWSQHCRATKKPPRTNTITPNDPSTVVDIDLTGTADLLRNSRDQFQSRRRLDRRGRNSDDHAMGRREQERRHEKSAVEMSITEVLARSLARAVNLCDGGTGEEQKEGEEGPRHHISHLKMDGDIGKLQLQKSFFVEGVRIGWPFPEILPPQRQMAIHIIRALKRKLHVVLESPTGTGKSAAILCSVLAWQRFQAHRQNQETKKNDEATLHFNEKGEIVVGEKKETVPTIIYCSRTHSQVAQMVASLKKTPYRPRMTVLGSRERLCINRDLVGKKGVNINKSCRDRKRETDSRRKTLLKTNRSAYDDGRPFIRQTAEEEPADEENGVQSNEAQEGGTERRKKKPICSHYMHLTRESSIVGIQSRYLRNTKQVACCSAGGEQSSMGVHDIEDLVTFGKNPYQEKRIAIYRKGGAGSFGILLANGDDGGCEVSSLRHGFAAAMNGRLQPRDWIVAVNGEDTRTLDMDQMVDKIKALPKDPLLLDVLRGKGIEEAKEAAGSVDDMYSDEALCPYYASRALKNHADLIFAPYNYILDPVIRKSMQLSFEDAIVVLDEAHNVEDTLKESGSADFAELDLYQMMSSLAQIADFRNYPSDASRLMETRSGERPYPEVAHELLLFFEKLLIHMRHLRQNFETSPGLEKVKTEHERYHLSDDHGVEVKYSGPTGYGIRGQAVGCAPLLTELQITSAICESLEELAEALESHLTSKDREPDLALRDVASVYAKLALAAKNPEHFYMACIMKPNGNMDYATRKEESRYTEIMQQQPWKRHPRKMPYILPRNQKNPDIPLNACNHQPCKKTSDKGYVIPGRRAVYHGSFCNGEIPRWECHLVLRLLSPGLMLGDLRDKCRTLIFASGSLAPIPSLCSELNLYGPKDTSTVPAQNSPMKMQALSQPSLSQASSSSAIGSPGLTKVSSPLYGRLQTKPKPLEANHVVNLPKQLFAVSIGHLPDASPLTVSYSHYKDQSFFPRLGDAVATVVESIPRGGVLLFFPSYSFLNKCVKCWNSGLDQRGFNQHSAPQIWSRLVRAKGKVIIEPTGSQEKFEAARAEYAEKIKEDGNCILLAVFRGKMSEGISFNDDNARCVICIGLPYPSFTDRAIKAKRSYNDEQRKIRKNTNLLPGDEWYSQQAYRALAQALGRCIRHAADYGAVVMMDSRLCDDGSPNNGICRAHQNLPKWMRHHMRTLSMRSSGGVGNNPVLGGYEGLARSLSDFFQQAPAQSLAVRKKWKLDLQKAQARSEQSQGRAFNRETGNWTSTATKKEASDLKL